MPRQDVGERDHAGTLGPRRGSSYTRVRCGDSAIDLSGSAARAHRAAVLIIRNQKGRTMSRIRSASALAVAGALGLAACGGSSSGGFGGNGGGGGAPPGPA